MLRRDDIENWSICGEFTIRKALELIDRSAIGILLVLDAAGKLMGTITDGDVRRGLLRGLKLDDVGIEVVNASPVRVDVASTRSEVAAIMSERSIRHLPIVEDDKVVGLWLNESKSNTSRLPAVLMAGGLGTRLGDLTQDTPKPLIDVGGQPILGHIISHLKKAGVENVMITTRYLAEKIETHFGNGEDWGVNIEYIREQERLGTAGALKKLEGRVHSPFLVMNGDLLTDFNVAEMLSFHEENGAHMTVGVRHYAIRVPFGVVEVDGLRISGISEKPTFDFFVNAGVYIVSPELLPLIEADRLFDITELMERGLEKGKEIISFPIFEDWLDVGRPEDLSVARSRY